MLNLDVPAPLNMALLLNAYYLQLTKSDPHDTFWGSEEAVEMQAYCGNLTSLCVGFDIAEEDKWTAYTNKATDSEIADYNINQLIERDKDLSSIITSGGRLYCVALEGEELQEWRKTLNRPQAVALWTEDNLSVDMGWSDDESLELLNLKVGDMAAHYGDFSHTIIRIK
jgi:hypothetical protein